MNDPGAGGKKGNGSGFSGKKPTRRKRVEHLKEKVEKGIYRVKTKKVAERMIEDAVRAIRSRDGAG